MVFGVAVSAEDGEVVESFATDAFVGSVVNLHRCGGGSAEQAASSVVIEGGAADCFPVVRLEIFGVGKVFEFVSAHAALLVL